jgi:hypothetical protein
VDWDVEEAPLSPFPDLFQTKTLESSEFGTADSKGVINANLGFWLLFTTKVCQTVIFVNG